MKRTKTVLLFLVFIVMTSCAQKVHKELVISDNSIWKGKQFAVSLTYDDGLDVHLDHVRPIVDSLGFKVTFYVHGNSRSLYNRTDEWRALTRNGHEIGSHSIFHPCLGKSLGRDWVNPEYDLDTYSLDRMEDELKLTKTLFDAIDGKQARTFAYPCSDTIVGHDSYVPIVKEEFTAARLVGSRMNHKEKLDLYKLYSFSSTGRTGDDLVLLAKQAKKEHAYIIFLFHGVGGGHPLNISIAEHKKLLHYLKSQESNMYLAPVLEVSDYINMNKSK